MNPGSILTTTNLNLKRNRPPVSSAPGELTLEEGELAADALTCTLRDAAADAPFLVACSSLERWVEAVSCASAWLGAASRTPWGWWLGSELRRGCIKRKYTATCVSSVHARAGDTGSNRK